MPGQGGIPARPPVAKDVLAGAPKLNPPKLAGPLVAPRVLWPVLELLAGGAAQVKLKGAAALGAEKLAAGKLLKRKAPVLLG